MATFENETNLIVTKNKPIFNAKYKSSNIYSQMSLIVDSILRANFKQMCSDNVSVIIICFENFKKIYENSNLSQNALKLKKTKNENIVEYVFKHIV